MCSEPLRFVLFGLIIIFGSFSGGTFQWKSFQPCFPCFHLPFMTHLGTDSRGINVSLHPLLFLFFDPLLSTLESWTKKRVLHGKLVHVHLEPNASHHDRDLLGPDLGPDHDLVHHQKKKQTNPNNGLLNR